MVDYEELSQKVCDFLKRAILAAAKNTLSVQDLDERVKRLEGNTVLDNRKVILDESNANRDGRPPISEDIIKIGENLRLQGKPYAEIADTIGISVTSAYNYLKDIVVPPKAEEQEKTALTAVASPPAPPPPPPVAPTSAPAPAPDSAPDPKKAEAIARGREAARLRAQESMRIRREREAKEQAAAEAAAALGENTSPKTEQNNGRVNVQNLNKF